jgi:hypothetical protein
MFRQTFYNLQSMPERGVWFANRCIDADSVSLFSDLCDLSDFEFGNTRGGISLTAQRAEGNVWLVRSCGGDWRLGVVSFLVQAGLTEIVEGLSRIGCIRLAF